ncbi:gamma-tubulin complex component 3 [Ursus arctos]|uniref:gamma-tubulin complex component 3 n=1 Tax=Ursus arctos TaxID=9644 RepID=UPI002546F2C0|nr:gamma-tubulin complex component 3 [Ursus arctos]
MSWELGRNAGEGQLGSQNSAHLPPRTRAPQRHTPAPSCQRPHATLEQALAGIAALAAEPREVFWNTDRTSCEQFSARMKDTEIPVSTSAALAEVWSCLGSSETWRSGSGYLLRPRTSLHNRLPALVSRKPPALSALSRRSQLRVLKLRPTGDLPSPGADVGGRAGAHGDTYLSDSRRRQERGGMTFRHAFSPCRSVSCDLEDGPGVKPQPAAAALSANFFVREWGRKQPPHGGMHIRNNRVPNAPLNERIDELETQQWKWKGKGGFGRGSEGKGDKPGDKKRSFQHEHEENAVISALSAGCVKLRREAMLVRKQVPRDAPCHLTDQKHSTGLLDPGVVKGHFQEEPKARDGHGVTFSEGLPRKGGELASAVHAYTKTGDPYVRSLVQHILSLVSHPVLSFLYRWIYDGELEDTYHEFFVASDPAVKTDRLWQDKYTLRKSMIPSFITMDQSRKVLLIGKSINFLHQVCHDQTPTTKMIAVTKSADSPQDAADLFTDLENAFRGKIDAAYFETSKYLLDVLNKKYSLLDHMQAVRRYLLLGQGDFIRHLMDLLKPELVRPATTLYQHNLTGILETAVRATNAQFDSPEILKRLDVRLLEVSPGDTGWDVFSLDYHVDGPIATVFTRECMSHYLRVFNFLWRAKRMEYILTDIRKGHMCNAKLLRSMPEFSGVLHHCHILASEMVHFIHQMQYYITFEVLECSWDELWNKVQQAQDLDHIIAAHEVFLDTIISRCLLDTDSRALLNQLRAVFDQIIELQNTQDAIYRAALEELQRRLQFEEKKKQHEVEGRWGVTAAEEEEEDKRIQAFRESIPKMCSQLRILTHFYQGIVQQFLVLLTTSSDESLRFLSFRLDFNEHYEAREPRLRVSLGSRGRRGSHA